MSWKIVKSVGKSELIRPNFAPGLLLQDDDLTQVVNYGRDTLQTLLRAMLGGGVLCGLRVSATFDACQHLKITLACGTALDCHGRLIDIPNPQTIQIDNDCCNPLPPNLYLSLFPADRACAPRELTGTALEGEGETAYTRIREGWQILITDSWPQGACGCPESGSDCYASHNNGECGCDCDCNGVLLAKLTITESDGIPSASINHGVRRFVRPALLADPLAPSTAESSTQQSGSTPAPSAEPAPAPSQAPEQATSTTSTQSKKTSSSEVSSDSLSLTSAPDNSSFNNKGDASGSAQNSASRTGGIEAQPNNGLPAAGYDPANVATAAAEANAAKAAATRKTSKP